MMSSFSVTTRRDGRRSFGEHDDRWSDGGHGGSSRGGGRFRGGNKSYSRGRGSYSRGGGSRGGFNRRGSHYRGANKSYGIHSNRGRGGGPDPRSRLDQEGDCNMDDEAGPSSRGRFNPYGRPDRDSQKRSNGSRDNYGRLQRLGIPIEKSHSDPQWYKVTIPKGKTAGKDHILKAINERLDIPFKPVNFHYEQEKAIFFVQDRQEMIAIREQDKKIVMPNGFKMILIVKGSPPPVFVMNDEVLEKLKVCMSNRYDPSSKSLNLSCLTKDQGLMADNIFMALNRHNVMSNVIKIIEENIPEIEALDLSDNKLYSLENLRDLPEKAPNVKNLNLGKNKLRHVDELRKVQPWKLEHLTLDGNELCDMYSDQNAYISAVRKKFPKVLTLDGHNLPPPIGFDLETSSELPERKDSFFINDEIQQVVVSFLKAFFTLYDSDNRQPLLEAYQDEALFSLSASYNQSIEYTQPKLNDYIQESRNFIRMSKDTSGARKNKLLKRGKLNIVSQLCLLPATTHDYNSFVVDVDHSSASLRSFTVEGVFKETDSRSDRPPIRSFSRRFVTVPQGTGMTIINDMLTVTNASREQLQAAFKHPAPTPSSSPVPDASPSTPFSQPQPAQPVQPTYSPEQQQMIQQFSAQSGMNHEWSIKCLEQNAWNYEKSGQIFLELQKDNKIPPEAFVK